MTPRVTRMFPHAVTAAAAAVVVLILLVPGAIANGTSVPAPPAQPTSADQIQNIDQVKTAIKAYYGDTLTPTPDPVNGTVALHTYSPTGAYANEMAGIEADAAKYLDQDREARARKSPGHDKPAILLDIDDTTLNTYSYEIYSNFVFNPTTNAAFVNAAVFPAVPGHAGARRARGAPRLHGVLPHRPPRAPSAPGTRDQPRQRRLRHRATRPAVPEGPHGSVALELRARPARRRSTSR